MRDSRWLAPLLYDHRFVAECGRSCEAGGYNVDIRSSYSTISLFHMLQCILWVIIIGEVYLHSTPPAAGTVPVHANWGEDGCSATPQHYIEISHLSLHYRDVGVDWHCFPAPHSVPMMYWLTTAEKNTGGAQQCCRAVCTHIVVPAPQYSPVITSVIISPLSCSLPHRIMGGCHRPFQYIFLHRSESSISVLPSYHVVYLLI